MAGSEQKKGGQQFQMPPSSVLEPEYAVGTGLITQAEFDALKGEFFSQSELSVGMILPLVCLAYALSFWISPGWRVLLAAGIAAASLGLYMAAVERRFQYRYELRILILGRWDKAQAAKKDSNGSNSSSRPSKIEETLNIAVDLKPLTVDFRSGPTNVMPAPPTPAPTPPPKPPGGSKT
jgi:hypothetical protein